MIGLPTVVLMITGAHYCDKYISDVLIGLYDPKVQQLWSIRGDNNQRLSLSEGDKSSLSFAVDPFHSFCDSRTIEELKSDMKKT